MDSSDRAGDGAGESGTGATGAGRAARSDLSQRMLGGGQEPDPRFTLANERTFLAWMRTSLALVAGGIAVEAFTGSLFGPGLRAVLSVALLVFAALLAVGAVGRWLRVERAMRRSEPLPLPLIVPFLAVVVAVGAAALLLALAAQAVW